jgi:hypothetical protein
MLGFHAKPAGCFLAQFAVRAVVEMDQRRFLVIVERGQELKAPAKIITVNGDCRHLCKEYLIGFQAPNQNKVW